MNLFLRITLFVLIWMLSLEASAQNSYIYEGYEPKEKVAFTLGVSNGMESLITANVAFMPGRLVGWQLEGSQRGLGAGMHFHFEDEITSSAVGFRYWHNGIGEEFTQPVAGLTFLFRSQYHISGELGLGYIFKNSGFNANHVRENGVIFLYSIGFYFSR